MPRNAVDRLRSVRAHVEAGAPILDLARMRTANRVVEHNLQLVTEDPGPAIASTGELVDHRAENINRGPTRARRASPRANGRQVYGSISMCYRQPSVSLKCPRFCSFLRCFPSFPETSSSLTATWARSFQPSGKRRSTACRPIPNTSRG